MYYVVTDKATRAIRVLCMDCFNALDRSDLIFEAEPTLERADKLARQWDRTRTGGMGLNSVGQYGDRNAALDCPHLEEA